MTRSSLYSILCTSVRLSAVYLFVDAIPQSVPVVVNAHTSFGVADWRYALGPPVMELVIAMLLWFFPGGLARLAASKRSLEHFESDIAPEALQYIAVSVLGLWFATTGLVQFAYTIHRWIFLDVYLSKHLLDPTTDPKVLGTMLSEIVRIILGATLALGARGITGVLHRFRQAGLTAAVAEEARREEAV